MWEKKQDKKLIKCFKMEKLLQLLPETKKDILLAEYTTYKIGGPAKYFFVAKNKDDLLKALEIAKKLKLQVFILGGGSNLLVSEKGFKGLVIKIEVSGMEVRANKIVAGAGIALSKLSTYAMENSLSGIEWSFGIPGATLGGSIYGCAQAFGEIISDNISNVEALDLKNFKIKNFTKDQCKFSLKSSIFKNPPAGGKNLIIVSAVLSLRSEDKDKIKQKMEEGMNYRKTNHPINFPSAGSTFVNPEIKIKNKKLLEKYPELVGFNEKGTIPAGYLIQKSGLQGKIIGGAQISQMHANFIINTGKAKAKDVLVLIKLAKQKVKKNFGIELQTEVQMLGF